MNYVSRPDLLNELENGDLRHLYGDLIRDIRKMILTRPVTVIIRCKYCKYYRNGGCDCMAGMVHCCEEDYCSRAEMIGE